MDEPHAVLVGNLTVGFHLVGPFPTYFAARDYVEVNVGPGHWNIFKLERPE